MLIWQKDLLKTSGGCGVSVITIRVVKKSQLFVCSTSEGFVCIRRDAEDTERVDDFLPENHFLADDHRKQ
jgi:hypothetical protein